MKKELECFCEDCGELIRLCDCSPSFVDDDYVEPVFRFEYAFEQLTELSSSFRRNLPDR